jgi:hypothetical protein
MTGAEPVLAVVVDDTAPSIIYSGDWSIDQGSLDSFGTAGATYNHTLHGTSSNGSTASYQFSGEYLTCLSL